MGEAEETLGRYATILFSRICGKWLAQNPQFQAYFWPIVVIFFVGGLAVAVAYEMLNRKLTKSEDSSDEVTPSHVLALKGMAHLSTNKTSLTVFQKVVEYFRVEAPKGLRIPLGISLVFLICAVVGDWPYDFFVLLRVVIFTSSIIALVAIWKADRSSNWLGVLLATVVIYNPLLSLHLHKSTWNYLNWAAIIVLGLLCSVLKPEQPSSGSRDSPTIN